MAHKVCGVEIPPSTVRSPGTALPLHARVPAGGLCCCGRAPGAMDGMAHEAVVCVMRPAADVLGPPLLQTPFGFFCQLGYRRHWHFQSYEVLSLYNCLQTS